MKEYEMAIIQFYEKPGCINGEKQKHILMKAGHTLECVNILEYAWTREELTSFLAAEDPEMIMNHTAPAIKNGELVPADMQYEEAVSLMMENPILIKRPLIKVDGMSIQGFMDERLKPYLGSWDSKEDVITCPNLFTISCDEKRR